MNRKSNLPTLGDYIDSIAPILGAVQPSDCDTDLNNEPAITVGFNDTVPVTGQYGADPLVCYITFDTQQQPVMNFQIPLVESTKQ